MITSVAFLSLNRHNKIKYNGANNMSSFKIKLKSIDFSSWFLSVGIGGLVTLYIIDICKLKLLPYFEETGNLVEQVKALNITTISITEIVILLLSILAILLSPLLKMGSRSKEIKIFTLIALFVLEVSSLLSIIIQHRINSYFIIFTLLFSILCFRILVQGISALNKWVRISKEDKKQVDVAKLTFIWAIIIALINLLCK